MTPREFLGEEEFKQMKTHYDELMRFRKLIKGKPTLNQRIELLCNAETLEYYQTVLFHTGTNFKPCDCRRCQYLKQDVDIYKPIQTDLFKEVPNIRIPFEHKLKKILDENY